VLVLDIDGVIILDDLVRASAYAVNNLNTILQKAQAKIVLSSTRRLSDWKYNLKDVCRGVDSSWIDQIVDVTPDFIDRNRTSEIQYWLNNNSYKQYCVVDDDDIDLSNFVKTRFRTGLDLRARDRVLRIFGVI
jgi:hypothetical protein